MAAQDMAKTPTKKDAPPAFRGSPIYDLARQLGSTFILHLPGFGLWRLASPGWCLHCVCTRVEKHVFYSCAIISGFRPPVVGVCTSK